jgi:putative transposase
VVQKITANGQSIRKALKYTGCSTNIYYHRPKPREIKFDQQLLEKTREIALQRPTYGTRRMAAMLTRTLKIAINRKRVHKIFRRLGYIVPSRTKREVIRSKDKTVKTSRPNEIWEVDLTYIYCGIDMVGEVIFSMYLIYIPENG